MARTKETELVKFAKAELKKHDLTVTAPYVMQLIKVFNKFECTDFVKKEIVDQFAKLALFTGIYAEVERVLAATKIMNISSPIENIAYVETDLEQKLLEEADMEIDNS